MPTQFFKNITHKFKSKLILLHWKRYIDIFNLKICKHFTYYTLVKFFYNVILFNFSCFYIYWHIVKYMSCSARGSNDLQTTYLLLNKLWISLHRTVKWRWKNMRYLQKFHGPTKIISIYYAKNTLYKSNHSLWKMTVLSYFSFKFLIRDTYIFMVAVATDEMLRNLPVTGLFNY